MSTLLWIALLVAVSVAAFLAGAACGRGFWRDVAWLRTRR